MSSSSQVAIYSNNQWQIGYLYDENDKDWVDLLAIKNIRNAYQTLQSNSEITLRMNLKLLTRISPEARELYEKRLSSLSELMTNRMNELLFERVKNRNILSSSWLMQKGASIEGKEQELDASEKRFLKIASDSQIAERFHHINKSIGQNDSNNPGLPIELVNIIAEY